MHKLKKFSHGSTVTGLKIYGYVKGFIKLIFFVKI